MERMQDGGGLRLQLLGAFRVWVGGQPIPETAWRRRKAASLLKLLALAPEQRLHREEALELLWPEHDPAAGENNLHRTLHLVRHALEPDLAPGTHSSYLCLQGDLLLLCPQGELSIDVDAFLQAAGVARQSQDPALSEQAIGLYTGDLLPEDQYEDWAAGRREELRRVYHDLLRQLSRLYEGRGQYRPAIEVLQRLIVSEPADEGAHIDLMRLYALTGKRHQALQQYERLREALQREIDAEPDAPARQLYDEIRAGRFPPESPHAAGNAPAAGSAPAGTAKADAVSPPTERVGQPGITRAPDASPPTNLPHHLSSFVGREQERAEVRRLLSTTRLLTLTGAAGVGKSRLAVQVATEALPEYPDGVRLVRLAALSDARLVPQTVAGVLGVQEQPDRSMTEALVDFLCPKHVLILLDNCEHLLDACGELAGTLLGSCSHLRILATSRRALGIAGEISWRVPSLALPDPADPSALDSLPRSDAVSLFLERTRSVRPSFTLTPGNAPAVVEVCRRLDGIPLAIELAAARMKVLTVEQLAQRLDDCFTVLGRGSISPLSRHRTLRATMDWSHDLLSEPEQMLFRRLAVFAGGWTLEAAERVCSGEGIEEREVLDLLSELVDHSLVVVAKQDAAMRYRLLEPVRQYAAQKLAEAGEEARLRQRHAAWHLALVESTEPRLAGPELATALERLERERNNLRAALSWLREMGEAELGLRLAGALWRFWWLHGHWSEGRRWLETLLAHGDAKAAGPTRAKALSGAGVLAYSQGDQVRAAQLHQQALSLYREITDASGVATALYDLGRVAHYRAEFQRAAGLYEESLALRRELEDRPAIALSLLSLASVERDRGHYERAMALAEESLALYRELEDSWGVALALVDLGRVARVRGEYRRAESLYQESLTLYRQLGDTRGIANSLDNLGRVAQEEGDLVRAEELHQECLGLYGELGDAWGRASTLHHLARDAYYRGDYRRAQELAEESLRLRRSLGDTWGIAHTLLTLAGLMRTGGEPGRAISLYQESLALYQKVGDRVGVAACLEGPAGAMRECGEAETAARLAGAASALRALLGTPLPPIDRAAHQRDVRAMLSTLGEARFVRAWQEGEASPLEKVVEEVLAWEPTDAVDGTEPTAAPAGEEASGLSAREREAAALVAQGRTNHEIAQEMGISERTVAVHIHHILEKLGFSCRQDIAVWAREQGLALPSRAGGQPRT